MTTLKTSKTRKNSKTDLPTQAADALTGIQRLTSTLPIDDAIPPNQMSATRVTSRVPLEALTIAAGILAGDPKQFPQFDAAEAKAAIQYEQEMAPVAQAALVLSKRITKSVLKRRSATAHQTLALYQVMKGTSRLATNEETRTQVQQLKKLFTTTRKSRETAVSQKETDGMVKTRKSAKKQAVAQANAATASNEAAVATLQATLDAAVAAGTVSALLPTTSATQSPVVTAPAAAAAPAVPAAQPVVTGH